MMRYRAGARNPKPRPGRSKVSPGRWFIVVFGTVLIAVVFAFSAGALGDLASSRTYLDPEPLLLRAGLSLLALFFGLSEAAGRRSLTGLFVAGVAFLLLGLDGRYLVLGFLNPVAWLPLLGSLLLFLWMLFALPLSLYARSQRTEARRRRGVVGWFEKEREGGD